MLLSRDPKLLTAVWNTYVSPPLNMEWECLPLMNPKLMEMGNLVELLQFRENCVEFRENSSKTYRLIPRALVLQESYARCVTSSWALYGRFSMAKQCWSLKKCFDCRQDKD